MCYEPRYANAGIAVSLRVFSCERQEHCSVSGRVRVGSTLTCEVPTMVAETQNCAGMRKVIAPKTLPSHGRANFRCYKQEALARTPAACLPWCVSGCVLSRKLPKVLVKAFAGQRFVYQEAALQMTDFG